MRRLVHISPARLVLAMLLLGGCTDTPQPTAPEESALTEAPVQLPESESSNLVFSDRVRPFPASEYDLVSSDLDIDEGRLVFVAGSSDYPEVERDDFVVAEVDGEPVVRRVLASRLEDGAMALETGPAYWHDVVSPGSYSLTIPFDGSGLPTLASSHPARVPITVPSGTVPLQPIYHEFEDSDVCALAYTAVNLLPGPTREVCGKEVDLEVGAGVTVAIAGTLDSLRILSGDVRVTGEMDIGLTVESGGVSGGAAPVFYPCSARNYLGCIRTPTGAALIDWLRGYAPAIPEASLPPVRMCVPGTPVRTRAGYWQNWYTWVRPTFVTCRITSTGTLPTVTLPSVQNVDSEIRPTVTGEIVMRVVGDGSFALQVAIPGVAASAAYTVTDDFSAKAKIGLFVLLKATIKDGAATVRFTFDDTGRVTQTWTDASGWDGDFELTEKNNGAQLLALDSPDSIVVRVGVPIEAKAELCIALYACETDEDDEDDPSLTTGPLGAAGIDTGDTELHARDGLLSKLNLGAKVGAGVSMFYEGTWSREQAHPDSVAIDNWHIAMESAYDVTLSGGLTIPFTGWILPDVPRSFDETWECCRVRLADYWGQAKLQVTTATSGVDPDPDGYSVAVERMDSLLDFVQDGATRILAWEPDFSTLPIGTDGSALFGELVADLPCVAIYSDAYLTQGILPYLAVSGARAIGVGIPNWALTAPCPFLVAAYSVELQGVAENCTVVDGARRENVWLQQGDVFTGRPDTRELHFEVLCDAGSGLGTLEVVMNPAAAGSGERPHVLLDGVDQGPVPPSDTLRLEGIMGGVREVALDRISSYCVATPETVVVVPDAVTTSAPGVVCAVPDPSPFGAVHYQASVDGEGTDRNGYALLMNGVSTAAMGVSGTTSAEGLPSEEPRAFFVSDIADNCVALEANPRAIALDAGGASVTVPFPVRCYDQPVDTIAGTVEATGWPTPTVYVRRDDGTSLRVNGPRTLEIARLSGTPVRAWGRSSATGIGVHAYDLRSVPGDDRWMGIVIDGPDGTRLHGRNGSFRLVGAPDALRSLSGALVWVAGTESGGDIYATLFGVIREGS